MRDSMAMNSKTALFVGRYTGIAEVMASNSVQAAFLKTCFKLIAAYVACITVMVSQLLVLSSDVQIYALISGKSVRF